MFANIAKEFQNITKFNLFEFFQRYLNFIQNDYSEIYSYYSGKAESVDLKKINELFELLKLNDDLIRTFQTFSGKLGSVGYWELQQYCQDLKDSLEKITKLPKFCRTAKTNIGYKPYIQLNAEIGGLKTIQDIANEVNISEQELILNNDLEECEYEIDKLSSIKLLINNESDIVINSILEQPIGKKIYGKDINRKITFVNNDLNVVEYEENIEQKCDILLELNKGDIPEFPQLGKNIKLGMNYGHYNYAELLSDLKDNFLQDDIFEDINIVDIKLNEGNNIQIICEILTKYAYSTTKNLKLYDN